MPQSAAAADRGRSGTDHGAAPAGSAPGDRPRVIGGSGSRRRPGPAAASAPRRAGPHSPAAPSRRTAARAAAPASPASIRPTGSPAGSRPPRPEVSTRSPMAKPGLSGRKRRTGKGELSPSSSAWSPELSTTTGMRELKSVISSDPRAALADVDHPADQTLRGRARPCPWRRPARPRRRAAAPARRRRRNRRRPARSAARPGGRSRHGQHAAQRPVLHRQPRGLGLPAEQPPVLLAQAARSPRRRPASSPTPIERLR